MSIPDVTVDGTRYQHEETDPERVAAMINALIMLAAAGFGFGGSPWIGFAICAPVAIVVSFPQHLDVLARYYGEPKTDIAFMILMYFCSVAIGAFASAWVGYFLALLLKP